MLDIECFYLDFSSICQAYTLNYKMELKKGNKFIFRIVCFIYGRVMLINYQQLKIFEIP